jgi:hypothetical protein
MKIFNVVLISLVSIGLRVNADVPCQTSCKKAEGAGNFFSDDACTDKLKGEACVILDEDGNEIENTECVGFGPCENGGKVCTCEPPITFFDNEVDWQREVDQVANGVLAKEYFDNIDDANLEKDCGQNFISSDEPHCWNKLRPGFSLESRELLQDEHGNKAFGELAGNVWSDPNGRPSVLFPYAMKIKFSRYAWDVKFYVFSSPDAVIWVEAFGKEGQSRGKQQFKNGDLVAFIGKNVAFVLITVTDGTFIAIDNLYWGFMRAPSSKVLYDPHFKTWGGKWYDYMVRATFDIQTV